MGSEMCIRDRGKVESLDGPLIQVSGRPSHRVPFGTGPSLVKINAQYEKEGCFSVYHPRIFVILGFVLSSVSEIEHSSACLLYTSDAADDMQCVDLGGRRIIKKQTRGRGGVVARGAGRGVGVFLMVRRPPGSTQCISSAASDVYKRQISSSIIFASQVFSVHSAPR